MLTPDNGVARGVVLERTTMEGCPVLVPMDEVDSSGEANPFSVYFRDSDTCERQP